MKSLTILLLSGVFLGLNTPVQAGDPYDTNVPEIEQFESKANIERAYNTLKEKFNIDTSFKFKQEALNYLLLETSPSVFGSYSFVTKNAVYDISTKNLVNILYKDCTLVKDEQQITVLRCDEKDTNYLFVEYINACHSGKCKNVDVKYFYSPLFDYELADKGFYEMYSTKSQIPTTEEENLFNLAEDENNPDGYYTKMYKKKYKNELKNQGT